MSYLGGRVTVHAGDCLDVIRTLADCSIDSVVTDPPYALVSITKRWSGDGPPPAEGVYRRATQGFMGKAWDTGDTAHTVAFWSEVLRVLKPGGHVLAFAGTRTYHRLACAIEDAGFEIRDQIGWAFGSGFPKSHDVSKGIDRMAGAERTDGAREWSGGARSGGISHGGDQSGTSARIIYDAAATHAARQWQGWGTALKPAWEPICVARKPLEGTVAANVLKHGTGALNIGACRVGYQDDADLAVTLSKNPGRPNGGERSIYSDGGTQQVVNKLGRWPANLLHDGSDEVVAAFPETSPSTAGVRNNNNQGHEGWSSGTFRSGPLYSGHQDSGSAARFFYSAKADADDRLGSSHPTIKPVDLMQYLVRLVTPQGGLVLDPFAGSGTTGEAAFREGCRAVLIEREVEYLADIERRCSLILGGPDERRRESLKARGKAEYDAGPLFAEVRP